MANAKTKQQKVRKKIKRVVTDGIVHIKASFNNTIIIEALDYSILKYKDNIYLIHFNARAINYGLVSIL